MPLVRLPGRFGLCWSAANKGQAMKVIDEREARTLELYSFFAQERETVDRLHNWGAWAKDRIARRTCFSLEGRYRPEKDDADRIAEIRVDMRDALKVAKALSRIPVAVKASHALTAWFVDGYREQAFSSHMRAHQYPTSRREIAGVMHDAVLVARNRLRR